MDLSSEKMSDLKEKVITGIIKNHPDGVDYLQNQYVDNDKELHGKFDFMHDKNLFVELAADQNFNFITPASLNVESIGTAIEFNVYKYAFMKEPDLLTKEEIDYCKQHREDKHCPEYTPAQPSQMRIQEMILEHTDNPTTLMKPESQPPITHHQDEIFDKTNSGADIADTINKLHRVLLPKSVINTIDAAISEGKLTPTKTYTLVCSAIDQVRNQDHSWKYENNPPGVHSAYVKSSVSISRDDIVIKPSVSGDKQAFEAYKVIDANNMKYLGSESTLKRLQKRVEAHVTCMKVRDVVNEKISLACTIGKVQEKKTDYADLRNNTKRVKAPAMEMSM